MGGGSPAALEPMRFGVEEGHMIISTRLKGKGNKRGEGRCKGFDYKGEGKRPWIGERELEKFRYRMDRKIEKDRERR